MRIRTKPKYLNVKPKMNTGKLTRRNQKFGPVLSKGLKPKSRQSNVLTKLVKSNKIPLNAKGKITYNEGLKQVMNTKGSKLSKKQRLILNKMKYQYKREARANRLRLREQTARARINSATAIALGGEGLASAGTASAPNIITASGNTRPSRTEDNPSSVVRKSNDYEDDDSGYMDYNP